MLIKALIFDVDGTLSETEDLHLRAFNDTFKDFGLDWHWSRKLYRDLLRTTGGMGHTTADVFEGIAAGDEVGNKKPGPDVYNLALSRLGQAPSDCVALEDSRNGLISAKSAGRPCIVSPSAYTNDARFDEATPW